MVRNNCFIASCSKGKPPDVCESRLAKCVFHFLLQSANHYSVSEARAIDDVIYTPNPIVETYTSSPCVTGAHSIRKPEIDLVST